MRTRTILFIILCMSALITSAQTKKRSNSKPQTPQIPFQEKADMLLKGYRFEEACELIQSEIDKARKKKIATDQLESLANKARIGANMLQATEKVVFVDSFVISKNSFLSAYRLSPACGTISTYGQTFPEDKEASKVLKNSTVYINEFKDFMMYSYPNKIGNAKLFTRNKLGDKWSLPKALVELGDTNDFQAYPYLLSDGTTLYFASEDENSLGGLDIYVTRYNTDTKQYVKPENIGMPFNSPANDYLYVIDETNNLGWFVSDRNQPEDKVCVYVFIPTETREVYDIDEENEDSIRSLAKIESIAKSQYKAAMVDEALNRLKGVQNKRTSNKQQTDFTFVVANGVVYHNKQDFRSAKAMQMAITWENTNKTRNELLQKLAENRHGYAMGKKDLKATLLKQEKELEQLDVAISTLEKDIRKEEQTALK